ncbi:MAG: CHAD domain-containing protein [Bacteroidetes bacterium]|nr:CHAD domain-containing protein [Bacteroidota bacterium]MBU1678678.1 CHAD domain-containing protein [Bacteroidota bacterium]MBU2508179.1 CHAD domain-containing protein [Bacteroidota bacterium]
MKIKKKLGITGLAKSHQYCEGAKIVLKAKIDSIFQLIDKFILEDSDENLHDLRISIRRLRYVLEVFSVCYGEKLLTEVLEFSKYLQDLIGEGRDLDVMAEKVRELAAEIGADIPLNLFEKFRNDGISVRKRIKMDLIRFKGHKLIIRLQKMR